MPEKDAKRRRSFWFDPRFAIGLVLVVISVIGVVVLVAQANASIDVLAARTTHTRTVAIVLFLLVWEGAVRFGADVDPTTLGRVQMGVGEEVIGLGDFFLKGEVFPERVGELFTDVEGFFL